MGWGWGGAGRSGAGGGEGWGVGGAHLCNLLTRVRLARVGVVVHEVTPAAAVGLHDAHVGLTLAAQLRQPVVCGSPQALADFGDEGGHVPHRRQPRGAVVLRVAREHGLADGVGECLVACAHRHAAARRVVGVAQVHVPWPAAALAHDGVVAHRGVGEVHQLRQG